ncbi:Aspartate aminotransferase, cytoplasmic [Boothiomyces macroporosus]|uniref:aspartate transaminase n=1 Tax=Boothiomyces macroporosus TaxID=261099 RepID=A0AAD5Y526_9FUNG|nr:Aspartate aminotransferase, cytoplasmic [Boothiomyces macroporosus]
MTHRRLEVISNHLQPTGTFPYYNADMSTNSLFKTTLAPPDVIFELTASYKADTDPNKINLGVGAYRDNDGKPWVLPVVKKAEHAIVGDNSLDHEYLPIDGIKQFTEASVRLILGQNSPAIAEQRYASAQTISGTGACRLGADFLYQFAKGPVYISNPTWANHRAIFQNAGFDDIREYPYWDPKTRGLAFEALLDCFHKAPNGSILLLHPCAHNPTGVDPTLEQWAQIAAIAKEKNHVVFFDCAYQGFASGDLEKDAQAVRYFVSQGMELLIAQSYAKNFGLYNERTGCLSIISKTPQGAKEASSQLCKIIRANYSNPPAFGARIVQTVLNNPQLNEEWIHQLKTMANRIIEMRQALYSSLLTLKTPGTWNHIVDQIGMFSFTGLTPAQVKVLRDKYHVYMTTNGRISMAGLNTSNVHRFAEAVDWVVRNVQ